MSADFNPVWLLIGVGTLVTAAIAIFVFIIVYLQRTTSQKPNERAPKQAVESAHEPVQTKASEPIDPTPLLSPASPGEVMRIVRDPETGRILVEIDGQRYAHIREIKDAQIGRRVLWAIADLLRFTGGMAANPQALKSIPPPEEATGLKPSAEIITQAAQPYQAEARPERPPTPSPARSSAAPIPVAPIHTPELVQGGTNVGQTISTFFRRGLQPASAPTQPSSFIDQIEAILQRRIENLAQPLPFQVHVQGAPDGTLEIAVGYQIYDSPAQVPDPQIRQLIQDAVAEWEKR
ncbi:MAG: hypothetical protein JW934_03065 [Anaerolineae bacterium]|nr:hypothetical protein [Anaerolineae bacterium]